MNLTTRSELLETGAVALFQKAVDEGPTIPASAKVPQGLVEQIDWIAQKENKSRNFCIERAMRLLVEQYETENKVTVGRIPFVSTKRRHKTSKRDRNPVQR